MEQQTCLLAPQRYTVSQLLQISRDAKYPFDLSKFTYDAARGVVPPLGDIAVSSRRSSSQRVRSQGWSSESVEATSEIVSLSGNASLPATAVNPLRQPSNPPTGPKPQKDAGFAKFLKKHSSPTHNRVTTGGRIVPMEKRDSPPKFDLEQSYAAREAFQSGLKDVYTPSAQLLGSPPQHGVQHADQCPSSAPLSPASEHGHGVTPGIPNTATVPQAGVPVLGYPMPAYGVPIMPPYPIPAPYYYMPGSGFPANPAYVPQRGWQPPAQAAMSVGGRDKFEGVEPTTQLLVTAQSCLFQAQSQYDLLDRQLKSMDRHRAVSTHDPTLAAQRMAVVQQRAELKAMINRLLVQVETLQNTKPLLVGSPSKFAPSARPFVPQANTQQSPAPIRPQSHSGSPELTAHTDRGFVERSPVPPARNRKIIPIVPPPANGAATGQQMQRSAESEPMWEVDKWGVRYRAVSDRSGCSTQQSLEPTKTSVVVMNKSQARQASVARKFSAGSAAAAEIIGWQGERPGSLPEELVGLTESYYDALRLPVGVITKFTLPNEDTFEVCGAALQPGDGMSEVEQSYWSRKPEFNKAILDGLRRKAQIMDADQYDDEYLLGAHVNPVVGVRDVQDLLQEAMNIEADRRRQAASAPISMPLRGIEEEDFDVPEDMSNKGFTSTSLQSVHATVRLPPSFDGATDNSRRDAKTVLTATSKSHNPRVLHRSAPGGGA
ncbi:uncharacterized protein AB675_4283 [Cyphellophora attinorum]|uniref:Uncharacterized protein n=1 Tax=Cyphellophora attinorum TaxID=1664694 RepID=A0A0N1H213_9EURO|nr:uncharacterized protein AB675_4283 [Phialophora attinorum]KPI38577.1 hypothetical protein AB675_4283 [Phialophora attinorum]